MSDRLTIAVLDEADLVVGGLEAILRPFADRFRVIAAPEGQMPADVDLALLDVFAHPAGELERLRAAAESSARACVYTWHLPHSRVLDVVEAGAQSILSKWAPAATLARDLRRAADGQRVVHDFPAPGPDHRDAAAHDLTEREIELLRCVAAGHSNAQAASTLYLAESSVKTYLKRLYRKLGVNNRAQAVMRAVELGVLDAQPAA